LRDPKGKPHAEGCKRNERGRDFCCKCRRPSDATRRKNILITTLCWEKSRAPQHCPSQSQYPAVGVIIHGPSGFVMGLNPLAGCPVRASPLPAEPPREKPVVIAGTSKKSLKLEVSTFNTRSTFQMRKLLALLRRTSERGVALCHNPNPFWPPSANGMLSPSVSTHALSRQPVPGGCVIRGEVVIPTRPRRALFNVAFVSLRPPPAESRTRRNDRSSICDISSRPWASYIHEVHTCWRRYQCRFLSCMLPRQVVDSKRR